MTKTRLVFLIIVSLLLTAAAPPNMINTRKGQQFIITLESNRTTGYEWQIASPLDKKIVKFIDSMYSVKHKNSLVGAGGDEKWIFRAIGKGKTTISLKYIRAWEKDTPPAQTADYTVIVE
ncbi:MAG: protease inhibitor I42 family protein [Candidatus Omnitrophica bacterium]|nr:protease inhibitor I42 family protein [Candidatus Omnitrophota bacterium]